MKTIKNIFPIALIAVLSLLNAATSNAQMSPYKFNQLFNQAFAQVVDGNHEQALPILERLYNADNGHGQVAYLYGVCRVKTNATDIRLTREVFQSAARKFDYSHQYGKVDDRTSPVKVWFYLAEVNADDNRISKAIEAYCNYMSCIPLASLDHKRLVKNRISHLKEQQLVSKTSVGNLILANLQR